MTVKEEIIKEIESMPDDSLVGVLEYIHFLRLEEQAIPSDDELQAISKGREEFSRGEARNWKDLKKHAV